MLNYKAGFVWLTVKGRQNECSILCTYLTGPADNNYRDNWFQLQGYVLVFKVMSLVSQDNCKTPDTQIQQLYT